MIGLPIFLGGGSSPFHLMAQLTGVSVRIHAETLQRFLETGPRLGLLLRTYSQAFFVQTAQNAACNGIHPISSRAARWLLATHDRAESDGFFLTQEFLAFMLWCRETERWHRGRRPRRSRIDLVRSRSHAVLDRAGLERASCECYGIVRAEFDRLLGIARA